MSALSDDVKVYIVTALACYDSPRQVIADVKEKFGLTVKSQQVDAYNPASTNGKRMSAKLKDLFKETRENFKKDVTGIPIANATVRLRMLDRMARKAAEVGNAKMAAALLEQAAKETGGLYTNRLKHEHTGENGAPIPVAHKFDLTDEALLAIAARGRTNAGADA